MARSADIIGNLGSLVIPSTGVYWGAEDQASGQNFTGANGIETLLGRRMAIRRQHYSWASGPAAMPTSFETANDALTSPKVIHMVCQRGDGNFPVVNTGGGWGSTNTTANSLGHKGMQQIVDGDFDSKFTAQFNGLKTLKNPVLYNLWFEMNGAHNNYYSLAQGTNASSKYAPGTGEAHYVSAYRHVRGLADAAGASINHGGNVIFVWCIQVENTTGWFEAYYPGDAYADVLAIDLYRRTFSYGTNSATPQVGVGDNQFYLFGSGTMSGSSTVNRGTTCKPMMVAEAGYGNGIAYPNKGATGDGANYFKDSSPYVEDLLLSDMKVDYVNFFAYVHWNESGITDNHVNQSGASLTAYKRFANDPYVSLTYGGTGTGGGGGGTPPPVPTITTSSEPANPTTSTSNTFQWTDSGGTILAVPFVGTTFERIEIPAAAGLNVNNFTISAWINPDFSVDTDPVHQRYEISEKSGCYWFNIREDTTPPYLLRVGGYFGAGPTINDTFTSNSSIVPGIWTHVACTYDGAHMTLYINGAQDAQVAQTGATASGTTVTGIDEALVVGAKHRLGHAQGGSGTNEVLEALFNGKMASYQLYNTALSAANIALVMNSAYSATTPVVDYEFDSITGNTVNDDSGNGHNGSALKGNIGSFSNWSVTTTAGPGGTTVDHYRYRVTTDGVAGNWVTTTATNSGALAFPAGHTYKFEVQAGNSSNTYSASTSYTWTVNVSSGGPAVPVIVLAPTAASGTATASNTAAFLWTEANAGTQYRYFVKLDTPAGAGSYPGTGQVELDYNVPNTPLAAGTYTFHVKAWDGTTFSAEATWTWIVSPDTNVPNPIHFTSVPTDPSTATSPTITWSQP